MRNGSYAERGQHRDAAPTDEAQLLNERSQHLYICTVNNYSWAAATANELGPKWARSGLDLVHFGTLLGQLQFGTVRPTSVRGPVPNLITTGQRVLPDTPYQGVLPWIGSKINRALVKHEVVLTYPRPETCKF